MTNLSCPELRSTFCNARLLVNSGALFGFSRLIMGSGISIVNTPLVAVKYTERGLFNDMILAYEMVNIFAES